VLFRSVEHVCDALDEAEKAEMWTISSPYMNFLTPSTYFCTTAAGEKELYTPDGAISACYQVQSRAHPTQEFLIGECNEETNEFIHYADRKESLKGIAVSNEHLCLVCPARYVCAGGCPLRNKNETEDKKGVDKWMCAVKKSLLHDAILRIEKATIYRKVPVMFGESIFEGLIDSNPSIKGERNHG
jgi:uncharacterized protein